MAHSESVLTGFDCTYNKLLGSDPSYTHVGNLHRGGGAGGRGDGAVGRGRRMTFQTTVKYVFVIMKLDVPRFLVKKTI